MWSSTSSRPIADDGIRCTDPVALNQWYPLATLTELRLDLTYQTMLLGEPLRYGLTGDSQGVTVQVLRCGRAAGVQLVLGVGGIHGFAVVSRCSAARGLMPFLIAVAR